MARFSVVTETAYNGRDGGIIVDCTWFSVSAFESAKIRCLDQLAKGKVFTVRFIDSAGQIHLEETGIALIPGIDEYEVLG